MFLIGLLFGSFLGVISYRLPRGVSFFKGRSLCSNCHSQISWYDNIPLLSFLFLNGKCRVCKNSIGIREPIIEISTGLFFVLAYYFSTTYVSIFWINALPFFVKLFFILFLFFMLMLILVTDIEHQIILDFSSFFILGISLLLILIFNRDILYLYLLSGIVSSIFFLLLHLITFGRGMGLGDVKLALSLGVILGPVLSFFWIITSFIIGGIIAFILLISNKAHLGQKIAFGPFLVVSFLIIFYFGEKIINYFYLF